MNKEKMTNLSNKILEYCNKFNIPVEFLFQILEDQKVTPMIRGKATEYNVFIELENILPKQTWSVQKLNLNAQTGTHDEDIGVTHRRTGIILKIESKNAVRGSAKDGKNSRKLKVPHFTVKCHRSRSNIKLAGTSNDRYSIDTFDVLITNTSNAIYQGDTVREHLEIVHNKQLKKFLFEFYGVSSDKDLISACRNDWRYCIPKDIGENGFIPRTPYVKLSGDENWKALSTIEERLLKVVDEKRKSIKPTRRH